jgi:hypothetical protein
MLESIGDRVHRLGGRRERDANWYGWGMKALPMSSNSNLMEELAIVKRDIGQDIRTASLALTLVRRGYLEEVSVRYQNRRA